jgi:hypothetical protein
MGRGIGFIFVIGFPPEAFLRCGGKFLADD